MAGCCCCAAIWLLRVCACKAKGCDADHGWLGCAERLCGKSGWVRGGGVGVQGLRLWPVRKQLHHRRPPRHPSHPDHSGSTVWSHMCPVSHPSARRPWPIAHHRNGLQDGAANRRSLGDFSFDVDGTCMSCSFGPNRVAAPLGRNCNPIRLNFTILLSF